MQQSTRINGALRRTRLATAMAIAIGASGFALHADARAITGAHERPATAHAPRIPARPQTTYEVTSCADDGSPGTLRYVIDHASDGDSADLGSLTCSTITLASGQIVILLDNFSITAAQPITIDAGRNSRVIAHSGSGLLYLKNIDAENGYLKYNSATGMAKGGCILSNGRVELVSSSVAGCGTVNTQGQSRGGGIYAEVGVTAYAYSSISGSTVDGTAAFGGGIYSFGSVYLSQSSVSGNTASAVTGATGATISGGGVFTSGVARLVSSTISGNTAQADNGTAIGGGVSAASGAYLAFTSVSANVATAPASSGGGIQAQRNSYIYYSTIDHNQSVNNSAMVFNGPGELYMGNSTISTNTSTTGSSAMFSSVPSHINNCTIAFNVAAGNDAGLYFYPGGSLDIESTIVSNNTSTSGTSFDFVSRDAVTGSHNLIEAAGSSVPGDTISGIDPGLLPLGDNFTLEGPQTHALSPTSIAIDRGSNPRGFSYDERGAFHARVFGATADIGAYEWDGTVNDDTIFANGFD